MWRGYKRERENSRLSQPIKYFIYRSRGILYTGRLLPIPGDKKGNCKSKIKNLGEKKTVEGKIRKVNINVKAVWRGGSSLPQFTTTFPLLTLDSFFFFFFFIFESHLGFPYNTYK
jgi:hypothetical protein